MLLTPLEEIRDSIKRVLALANLGYWMLSYLNRFVKLLCLRLRITFITSIWPQTKRLEESSFCLKGSVHLDYMFPHFHVGVLSTHTDSFVLFVMEVKISRDQYLKIWTNTIGGEWNWVYGTHRINKKKKASGNSADVCMNDSSGRLSTKEIVDYPERRF